MAKRYYLCDVVAKQQEDGSTANVAVIADYDVSFVAVTGSGQALCLVNADNHTQLLNDNRIDALPIFPLDAKISAMHITSKNEMMSNLTKRNFSTGLISPDDGYRDVIKNIGKSLTLAFDENNFNIG